MKNLIKAFSREVKVFVETSKGGKDVEKEIEDSLHALLNTYKDQMISVGIFIGFLIGFTCSLVSFALMNI